MAPVFLIVAPEYSHRSAGIRALYRLCHHLNSAGYPAAMAPIPGQTIRTLPEWNTPLHTGRAKKSIVIYPEIVSGNPLGARRVVRWALNNPGLLAGDKTYADDEMVFVFNPDRLGIVNQAVRTPIGPERILNIGLIDPEHIYPDRQTPKTLDCVYSKKGDARRSKFRLPNEDELSHIEAMTPSMASLGDVLRRTRTLYSYNHASNILKEAVICGCRVLVVDANGRWHDPETCDCAYNIYWEAGFRRNYARRFRDHSFVHAFVGELEKRWKIPRPAWRFRLRRRLGRTTSPDRGPAPPELSESVPSAKPP